MIVSRDKHNIKTVFYAQGGKRKQGFMYAYACFSWQILICFGSATFGNDFISLPHRAQNQLYFIISFQSGQAIDILQYDFIHRCVHPCCSLSPAILLAIFDIYFWFHVLYARHALAEWRIKDATPISNALLDKPVLGISEPVCENKVGVNAYFNLLPPPNL